MGLMKQAQAMQAKIGRCRPSSTAQGRGPVGRRPGPRDADRQGPAAGHVAIDVAAQADEKEILEDLIVTAHADARSKAERLIEEKMQGMTAGLALPPGMKLPF